MKRVLAVVVLSAAGSVSARADDHLLKFDGGIGVIPVSSVNTATEVVTANVVRGVPPGGFPWVIDRLTASVRADGQISVDGRGLLLAGGNGIGTNGGQQVAAWLFCGPAATATVHKTATVPLEADGDFRIDDVLSPAPPSPCDTPVLLIVNANGAWFAAGIVKQ